MTIAERPGESGSGAVNPCCLHVVIPTHNRQALLQRCLDCLAVQDDKHYTVTVVNDGSSDGTAALLQSRAEQISTVNGDGNLWWTGAIARGIDYIRQPLLDNAEAMANDAVVLLNDDLEFAPDFLSTLRSLQQSNGNTLIGSVVIDIADRRTITHGGALVNWLTAKWSQRNRGADIGDFPETHAEEVSVLTGRGVLVPLRVFSQIGSYNFQHFPQHGDIEFPVRANQHGYRLRTFYRSRVYCHFDLAGDVNTAKTYGLGDIKALLTDQRSYLNLKERFWFAYDTRTSSHQFVLFLVFDWARVSKSVLEKLAQHYLRRVKYHCLQGILVAL